MSKSNLMAGFDPKFKTPEEYILGCTYEIWEERGVGLITDSYYSADCVLKTPLGVSNTADAVVAGTFATLAEFPDRQALGEDMIIGLQNVGFYSSHRVRTSATHLGSGRFGHATGKALNMLTIADCVCRENRIVDEWLVRNQAGIARQLGIDPVQFGAELGRAHPAAAAPGSAALLDRWADAKGLTIEGDKAIAKSVIDAWSAIWNGKNLRTMRDTYDRAVRFEAPTGELHYGVSNLDRVLITMLSSIPDGTFKAHHAIAIRAPDRPVRVAVRWSYAGKHAGHGRYGAASGADLVLLGISHVELRDGRIINEWMTLDELSVYAQIAVAKG